MPALDTRGALRDLGIVTREDTARVLQDMGAFDTKGALEDILSPSTKPSMIGTVLRPIGRALTLTERHIAVPLAKAVLPKGLEKAETFADVAATLIPSYPEESFARKALRFTAGFVPAVLTDPLTFTGFGAITKFGKLSKLGKSGVEFASSVGERAALGQQALVSFAGQPVVKGGAVMEAIGKGVEAVKASGLGKLFFKPQAPDIP